MTREDKILKAEAQRADERPHIARVYLNRLEKKMRMQADPTVGYALGRGPRVRLFLRDLAVCCFLGLEGDW